MSSDSVAVAVGEEFEIRLQGNPSAGYVWRPEIWITVSPP